MGMALERGHGGLPGLDEDRILLIDVTTDLQRVHVAQQHQRLGQRGRRCEFTLPHIDLENLAVARSFHRQDGGFGPRLFELASGRFDLGLGRFHPRLGRFDRKPLPAQVILGGDVVLAQFENAVQLVLGVREGDFFGGQRSADRDQLGLGGRHPGPGLAIIELEQEITGANPVTDFDRDRGGQGAAGRSNADILPGGFDQTGGGDGVSKG